MASVSGPMPPRRVPRLRGGRVAFGVLVAGAALAVVVGLVAGSGDDSPHGSGQTVTSVRAVAPFTAVELAGANTVTISVGSAQSVAVAGDDNLVDDVTTTVSGGRLVIDDPGSFDTEAPMSVTITMPSLDGLTLSGMGTVTVVGVTGPDFTADLSGTGTLQVSGRADRVTATMSGLGTLDLQTLAARDVIARLDGAGDLYVQATATLDATLTGTGSIVYSGLPVVTEHKTGTGSITGTER